MTGLITSPDFLRGGKARYKLRPTEMHRAAQTSNGSDVHGRQGFVEPFRREMLHDGLDREVTVGVHPAGTKSSVSSCSALMIGESTCCMSSGKNTGGFESPSTSPDQVLEELTCVRVTNISSRASGGETIHPQASTAESGRRTCSVMLFVAGLVSECSGTDACDHPFPTRSAGTSQ